MSESSVYNMIRTRTATKDRCGDDRNFVPRLPGNGACAIFVVDGDAGPIPQIIAEASGRRIERVRLGRRIDARAL